LGHSEQDRKGDVDFTLRVFVRVPENQPGERPTKILEAVRRFQPNEVELFLPEGNKIVTTGWVPEVIYKMKEKGDLLDIVLKPDPIAAYGQARAGPRDSVTDVGDTPAITVAPAKTEIELQPTSHATESVAPHSPAPARGDEVLYRVTFENRLIMVNGVAIANPKFDSENEVVFSYLFAHPNLKRDLGEIQSAIGRPIKKRLGEIVRDLGFRFGLKRMFFPDVSKSAIRFVNPITRLDFAERGLAPPFMEARRDDSETEEG
jgi:hypothetical protein